MGLFDKLTGKAKRDAEAEQKHIDEELLRTAAEHEARLAEERKAKRAEAKAKKEAKKAEEAKKAAEAAKKKDPKALATAAGEPWVTVLSMDIDTENPSNGAFELDWNDIFVARLIKAGYQGKTDQDIVDNWFRAVCSNVVMENFEQEMADPEKRANNTIQRRDLGGGKAEFS